MIEVALNNGKKPGLGRRIFNWSRRINMERRIAIAFLIVGAASGLMTYLVLTDTWQTQNPARAITWLLLIDFIVVLSLGTMIARRFVVLWIERRRGMVGAKLHSRLVLLFGLIALIPAITVSVFSTTFLNYGLDIWFGDKIKSAIESSFNVSQSYLQDHQQRVANDTLSIANEIRDQIRGGYVDLSRLAAFLDRQVDLRDLSEAVVIDRRRQILASGGFALMMEFDLDLPENALVRADAGETVVLASDTGDRIRALVAIDAHEGVYLYAGRVIEDQVLTAIRGNENAVNLYRQLEGDRSQWQITVGLIFAVLALLLLMAAIWVAIISATNLVKPILRLVEAAQRLGGGDLSTRVKTGKRDDELGELSRTFNTMALRLQTQQVELVATNQQLDDRRRFTELVLAGVSAGVIGLNDKGEIELPNRSASELLGRNMMQHVGKRLGDLLPEMGELVALAQSRQSGSADGQINLSHGPVTRTLHVRVVSERADGDNTRIVVTFDDVTELLAAQRKAAWSDIARRIAHEIKNPLTPIQLSAERLKRKYLKEIINDPETFAVCTDTIVRQVGDIGRLVDEFSSFARMPAPVLRAEDLVELARQAAFLQQSANSAIVYDLDLPVEPIWANCDSSQVARALTNLLQNAADAIEARLEMERAGADGEGQNRLTPGRIHLWIRRDGDEVVLGVDDNGRGLPPQGRERLTDPYVTTRVKGTGLGLAIVKKIMEDHGGKLQLLDGEMGGASVRLIFPAEIVLADPALKSVQA
ncbi:sensor histidine kinase NtrY-like [Dongia deserti]|uniref:sensor histidine kinase NtrY-like n=1 Tax=Dongia deserti TaxID=2268030 RepID=UPI000E65D60D|nr:PAS domain-containing sensor histidine kinase [Dongia deserti]